MTAPLTAHDALTAAGADLESARNVLYEIVLDAHDRGDANTRAAALDVLCMLRVAAGHVSAVCAGMGPGEAVRS